MEDEFSLDEARETLFTLQRACERHATVLGKTVEVLNSKKEDDEWLLEVLGEAAKGVTFHQQQQAFFADLHARVSAYIEAVRNEANQLALQELSGGVQRTGSDADGAGEDGPAPAPTAAATAETESLVTHGSAAEAGAGAPAATRRKSSKIVHPELQKFKLEKQAKILGKYGGVPALGAGLALPRLQRDSILKATASAAAREIHYSKVEGKDAPHLAEVMRFKVRKNEEGGATGGTPPPSTWQAELSAKKGKTALDGTDAKDLVTPSTKSHTAYGEELGSVLQQRQAALEEALQAARTAVHTPTGPQISQDANGELADKLRRRQAAAKQAEAAAAEAEAAEAAAATTPATPAWSNATAPFGGELTSALQRRAEAHRAAVAAGAAASTPGPGQKVSSVQGRAASSTPGPGHKVAGSTPAVAPQFLALTPPGKDEPSTSCSSGGGASAQTRAAAGGEPHTPVLGLTLQARRSVPPSAVTPAAAVMAGGVNELQEKLHRRLSALEGQSTPPVVASEAKQ